MDSALKRQFTFACKFPFVPDTWAVTLSCVNDGYVRDTEASKINYPKLIQQMQAGTRKSDKRSPQAGLPLALD